MQELTGQSQTTLVEHLKQLESFPQTRLDIIKISGEKDTFRLRIGKYRALFKVYDEEKTIVVAKIDLRRRIYK
jgi:mRNA interferase RelE/StbE